MVPTADIVLTYQELHSDALNSDGYTLGQLNFAVPVGKRGVQDQIEGPWGARETPEWSCLPQPTPIPAAPGQSWKVQTLKLNSLHFPVVSIALVDENNGGQGVPGSKSWQAILSNTSRATGRESRSAGGKEMLE